MPPNPLLGVDKIYWRYEPSGNFTVRSAYESLCQLESTATDNAWNQAWSWKGPQAARIFLWQVLHAKLKTKSELSRRHIPISLGCDRCGAPLEDIIHVLRDCYCIKRVWLRIVPARHHSSFFQSSLQDWIIANLQNKWNIPSPLSWECIFGVAVWRLWYWRNHFIVEGKLADSSTVYVDIMAKANEIHRLNNSYISQQPRRKEIYIGWLPPPWPWCKLNTDGFCRKDKRAGASGIIRDSVGHWITGFCMNIGESSVLMAELWGLYQGLRLTWEAGIKRLLVEVDNLCVTQLVSKQVVVPNEFYALVVAIRELISRNWQVSITHIYREANSAADFMANMAHSYPHGLHLFSSPPVGIYSIIVQDLFGVTQPRFIPI